MMNSPSENRHAQAPDLEEDFDSSNEDVSHITNDGYKIYRKRWFVVFAAMNFGMIAGVYRGRLPIVDTVYDQWGTNVQQVASWSVVTLSLNAITMLPFGRFLDYHGIRRVMYLNCVAIWIGHSLYAATFFRSGTFLSVPKSYRFPFYLLGNAILGLSSTSLIGLNAKIAYDWFPKDQTTIAIVLPTATYQLVGGFSAYLSPKFIKSTEELYIMGYLYLVTAQIVCIVVLICVKRSRPKLPPSLDDIISSRYRLPLRQAIPMLLRRGHVLLALVTLQVNLCVNLVLANFIGDLLKGQRYSEPFCGSLMLVTSLVGFVASFGAAWFDRIGDYIKVSRYTGLCFAISYGAFSYYILSPGNDVAITATNVIHSSALAIMAPLLTQAILRSSKGIMPDASLMAISGLLGTGIYELLTYMLYGLLQVDIPDLKKRSVYVLPISVFAVIIVFINFTYAVIFQLPGKVSSRANSMYSTNDLISA